jgi:hypothetical protein
MAVTEYRCRVEGIGFRAVIVIIPHWSFAVGIAIGVQQVEQTNTTGL